MSLKISKYGYNGLMIETKSSCNMQCKFCPYPLIKDHTPELSSDEVYEIIDSIDRNDDNFDGIFLHGFNEPLLDSRIFEFIKYIKHRGLKVSFTTNGILLKSKKIREDLIESEPTHIRISLQTLNENVFLKARGINYSFNDYKTGIFQFLEETLNHESNSTIVMDVGCNYHSYQTQVIWKIIGIECGDPSISGTIHTIQEDLLIFLKELNQYNNSFIYDEENIKKYLQTADPYYHRDQNGIQISKNIFVKVKMFFYGRKLSDFYPAFTSTACGSEFLKVSANGSVAPCCLIYDNIIDMGNIKNETLPTILERNKTFLSNIKTGKYLPNACRKCQGAPTRRGVFILAAYNGIHGMFNKLRKSTN